MKYLYTTVLSFLLFISFCKAQWVYMPDVPFSNYLRSHGYMVCIYNAKIDTSCTAVVNATKLELKNLTFSNLGGIEYFDNLDTLIVDKLPVTTIPRFPPKLKYLYIANTDLTTLPDLPSTLTEFYCPNNKLTAIPALPAGLTVLECGDNPVTTLPTLPAGLQRLNCKNDFVINLPTLPNTLVYLNCVNCKLNGLPVLPSSLTHLDCGYNYINQLSGLPAYLNYFDISHSPYIECLPYLETIDTFYYQAVHVVCAINYGTVAYSVPDINTLPICTFSNDSNNCLIGTGYARTGNKPLEITLAPNPAGGELRFSSRNFGIRMGDEVTVTDMLGRTLISQGLAQGANRTAIDVSNLANGVYLLTLKTEGGTSVKKFIKE